MRWFGTSWGGEVCDPAFHIQTPVTTKCLECSKQIGEQDRGIVAACSPSVWGHWRLKIDNLSYTVCSYHLSCFLAVVIGGETEGTRISERAVGAMAVASGVDDEEIELPPESEIGAPGEESAEPGRGWKR